MGRKLLVVDDDEISCRLVKAIFAPEGIEVAAAHDGPSGLDRIVSDAPDVVLLDLGLPGLGGMEVLERARGAGSGAPVIVLTAERDVKTAVHAIQAGAFDYLTKPFDRDEVVIAVRRALEATDLRAEVEELRRRVDGGTLSTQMGPSPEVREIVDQVRLVAASNFTVLIVGETGTGKELIAQAIHRKSDRRTRPFVALDCGAIPDALLESELFGHEKGAFSGADRRKEGRFQLAEGGTFFLDEIGNLSLGLQAKLLRVLESRQVHAVGAEKAKPLDVRFVAATNFDLQARANEGAFRADLYFRIAQYTIRLPPLRSRVADVAYLAQRFLEEASVELRKPVQDVAPEALDLLRGHAWPGNVRELRNVIRQAVLATKELSVRSEILRPLLGKATRPASPSVAPVAGRSLKEIADEAARAAERRAITEVLRSTKGNKAEAARLLRTDYKTLHLKMKSLGLRARDFDV